MLGSADKLRLLPTASNKRFTVLQTGEVDVLSRMTTWTFARDTGLGLNFAGILYHDGQSFLVRKDSGVTSSRDLHDATICISKGTTGELNTADYFASPAELPTVAYDVDVMVASERAEWRLPSGSETPASRSRRAATSASMISSAD